jgi:two-component system nitrate/nitrite response regulator NarL
VIDILFVDDHPTMRYLIRQVLQTYAEFTIVGEATNGEEAVTQAAALQPSVILIDVNLPAMNGMQATKPRFRHYRAYGRLTRGCQREDDRGRRGGRS